MSAKWHVQSAPQRVMEIGEPVFMYPDVESRYIVTIADPTTGRLFARYMWPDISTNRLLDELARVVEELDEAKERLRLS